MNPELPINEVFSSETYLSVAWPPVVQAIATAWLFVLGSVFGSFLNVVVYRVPRSISLNYPGSHCPACGHPIRWYDNVPVFGWLKLGGRCRDCGAAISPRYPLVEALVGVVFAALVWLEVFLPQSQLGPHNIPIQWARYAVDLVLLCTLLCVALMRFDGQRVPLGMLLAVMVIGTVAAAFAPGLRPLALAWPSTSPVRFDNGLLASLAGTAAGALLGAVVWILVFKRFAQVTLASMTAELAMVGSFCGWQGTMFAGAFAVLLSGIVKFTVASDVWRRFWSIGIALGSLAWIVSRCLMVLGNKTF